MKPCIDEPVQDSSCATKRAARPQPTCVLSIGGQQLPAAIIEERGGTMHVVVQGSPQFWVEDDGTLKTPDADFLVRVFNIVREEDDEADDDETVGDIPTFRIGLERLGQVERTDDPDAFDPPVPEPKKIESAANGEKKAGISHGVLALVTVTAVLVGAVVAWQAQTGNWTLRIGGTNSKAPASGEPSSQSSAEKSGSAGNPAAPGIDLSNLPGASPFAQPEIAKKLELTPSQTDAIRRLNTITLEAVNDLEKYWGSGDRWELAKKRTLLLGEARQQALQLLTDPQRQVWDELTK